MGTCKRKINYFGTVTVTDKGQIAIPIELRRCYGIEKGDKLIIIKRKDGKGINLLKVDVVGEFLDRLAQN
jgi:AbrB family looped-hinge helix DNA binding protein